MEKVSANARLPADMGGHQIEFCDVGSRAYQVVLRVGEPRRALGATAHAM
jgi:hypothetical protein